MNWLIEPWQVGLVARGGLILGLVGLACGTIGAFVVMRGLSYAGESLSHAVLPGAVLAVLFGAPIAWGAAIAALLAALAVGVLARGRTADDTALGVVFVGALGLAVVLLSQLSFFVMPTASVSRRRPSLRLRACTLDSSSTAERRVRFL